METENVDAMVTGRQATPAVSFGIFLSRYSGEPVTEQKNTQVFSLHSGVIS